MLLFDLTVLSHLAKTMIIFKKLLFIFSICLAVSASAKQDNSVIEAPSKNIIESLMPTYGNWCGANHPTDINHADAPINSVDRACMTHDFCYQEKGYFDCGCDKAINDELIVGLREHQYAGAEFVYGKSIHLYFDGSPCQGDHSGKFGPSQAIQNTVKKASDVAVKLKDKAADILESIPFF